MFSLEQVNATGQSPAGTPGALEGIYGRFGWAFGSVFLTDESDLKAEVIQPFGEFAGGAFRMASVEVITAAFVIFHSLLGENAPGNHRDAMSHGDGSFLQPASVRKAEEQRSQETIFRVGGCPGALNQNAPDVAVTLSRAPGKAFARALRISRA